MRGLLVGSLVLVVGAMVPVANAFAEGAPSEYVREGWEIKAVSQMSSMGYTQVILQKGTRAVVCSIYYSITEGGWTSKGCDPLP